MKNEILNFSWNSKSSSNEKWHAYYHNLQKNLDSDWSHSQWVIIGLLRTFWGDLANQNSEWSYDSPWLGYWPFYSHQFLPFFSFSKIFSIFHVFFQVFSQINTFLYKIVIIIYRQICLRLTKRVTAVRRHLETIWSLLVYKTRSHVT